MWLCCLFPSDRYSGPLRTLEVLSLSPGNSLLCLLGAALGRRCRQRAGLGPNGARLGRDWILAVVFSCWHWGWGRLVLSEAAACLCGQIAPPPPGGQHASLLRPDWPRPALNSGRLISFTKVKGARLRWGWGAEGPCAQTGGPFIPQGLDWNP